MEGDMRIVSRVLALSSAFLLSSPVLADASWAAGDVSGVEDVKTGQLWSAPKLVVGLDPFVTEQIRVAQAAGAVPGSPSVGQHSTMTYEFRGFAPEDTVGWRQEWQNAENVGVEPEFKVYRSDGGGYSLGALCVVVAESGAVICEPSSTSLNAPNPAAGSVYVLRSDELGALQALAPNQRSGAASMYSRGTIINICSLCKCCYEDPDGTQRIGIGDFMANSGGLAIYTLEGADIPR
jgi:hypothetical protein